MMAPPPDWYLALAPLVLLALLPLFFSGCVGDDPSYSPSTSLLKLNMDLDLQKPTSADTRRVKEIKVSWQLWSLGAIWTNVPGPPIDLIPTDATDDFLDPRRDPGGNHVVSGGDVTKTDQVSCTCVVRQGDAGTAATDETVTIQSAAVPFSGGTTYVFSLTQKPPANPGSKRTFVLNEYTPS